MSRGFLSRLLRKPLPAAALAFLTIIVLAVIFAPLLTDYKPEQQDLLNAYKGPSGKHWLGTGELGKDVFARLLYGGRTTLTGALISTSIFALVGISVGLIAGYRGGFFDKLIQRIAELLFAVPGIMIMLVVLSIFPDDTKPAMVALGLLGSPGLALVVRSVTLRLRNELYVRAAELNGLSGPTIMRRHLLPGLTGPVIVHVSLFGAASVGLETGLGFLGLGGDKTTWGSLVAEASENMGRQAWLLIPSGALIFLYTLCLGLVGDGARDAAAERRLGPTAVSARSRRRRTQPDPTTPDTPNSEALLSVRGLTASFMIDGHRTPVIEDINFDIFPGEAVGLVGESGCGKSATAAAILGLLPGSGKADHGQAWFEGVDLLAANRETLNKIRGKRIGWISQDPIDSLDPSFTIGWTIAEAVRTHRKCSRREARRRAIELLRSVHLADAERVADSYPFQLSGGMAQRAGIAAALACDPVLVFADEPTTALDVTVQAEILDLLRTMADNGTAVVLVTHDWGVLSDLCTRAMVMYAGQIVDVAPTGATIAHPLHPYTAGLLRANPYNAEPGEPLPQIDGTVPKPGHWPVGCHFQDRCPLATDECRSAPVELLPVGTDRLSRCLYPDRSSESVQVALDGAAS